MERSTMKQVTRQRMKWCAGALGCSLALFACIKREAVVKEPPAATSGGAASTTAAETTGPKPTGNYGKVPGVDVLGGTGIEAFKVQGAADRVATSVVDVAGQPFTKALRTQIK